MKYSKKAQNAFGFIIGAAIALLILGISFYFVTGIIKNEHSFEGDVTCANSGNELCSVPSKCIYPKVKSTKKGCSLGQVCCITPSTSSIIVKHQDCSKVSETKKSSCEYINKKLDSCNKIKDNDKKQSCLDEIKKYVTSSNSKDAKVITDVTQLPTNELWQFNILSNLENQFGIYSSNLIMLECYKYKLSDSGSGKFIDCDKIIAVNVGKNEKCTTSSTRIKTDTNNIVLKPGKREFKSINNSNYCIYGIYSDDGKSGELTLTSTALDLSKKDGFNLMFLSRANIEENVCPYASCNDFANKDSQVCTNFNDLIKPTYFKTADKYNTKFCSLNCYYRGTDPHKTTGGVCKSCDSKSSCDIYSTSVDSCNLNTCNIPSGCYWNDRQVSFTPSVFGYNLMKTQKIDLSDSCKSCKDISSCSSYKSEYDCQINSCLLGSCEWVNNECKSCNINSCSEYHDKDRCNRDSCSLYRNSGSLTYVANDGSGNIVTYDNVICSYSNDKCNTVGINYKNGKTEKFLIDLNKYSLKS